VSGQKAQELGLQVLARIRGYADAAQVSYSDWQCRAPVAFSCPRGQA